MHVLMGTIKAVVGKRVSIKQMKETGPNQGCLERCSWKSDM